MTRLVFLDTETTGLDVRRAHVWEVAWIVRDDELAADKEHHAFLTVPLHDADPDALDVGRYWDRHPKPYLTWSDDADPGDYLTVWPTDQVASMLCEDLRDAILVGFNPSFDVGMLTKLLWAHELLPTWHYRSIDVTTMGGTARRLEPPWWTNDLMLAYGIEVDDDARHTALGDARAARDLYDAIRARP